MSLVLLIMSAAVALALAAYAQLQIPRYTAARGAVLLRVVLFAVGVAFGCVAALNYASDPTRAMLALVIGFGVVHLPAAFILFIKHERGSGKS